MAIIRFAHDKAVDGFMPHYNIRDKELWPEGAYCPLGSSNPDHQIKSHGAMVLWETHQGLCLNDWERNGYDDSDFFMDVWNPEKRCVETILFATTRGWTYPSYGSKPDATPEVIAEVKVWRAEQAALVLAAQRLAKANELRAIRQKIRALAERYAFKPYRLAKLVRTEKSDRGSAALRLLTSSRLKNQFRIKMQTQLVDWLKQVEPKYDSPFSPKQWMYV